VYDTTKNLVPYDGEMYSLGWRWANERDGMFYPIYATVDGMRSCFWGGC
jgi:hypothetical protein